MGDEKDYIKKHHSRKNFQDGKMTGLNSKLCKGRGGGNDPPSAFHQGSETERRLVGRFRMKMKFCLIILAVLACLLFGNPVYAGKIPNEFKEKLFERYDKQNLIITARPGLVLGLSEPKPMSYDFNVRIIHFHESVEVPKKFRKLEEVDDRTFVKTYYGRIGIERIPAGERIGAGRFYVEGDKVRFQLRSRSATRISRAMRWIPDGIPGVHFVFRFPKAVMESGDYDTVVREISQYLVPEDEYSEQLIASREAFHKAREAGKQVEIQPGMSKEEVVQALGEPLKTIVFGNKTILRYADITVELEDNKVIEVKAN